MILKEYDLPFHTFMGGWQTDDKVIDDMMNYYDLNKENAIPGHSYDPELKKSSIKKEYKDSKDLYVNCEANYWPITSYLNLLGECTKKYLEKYWKQDIVFEEFPLVGTRMTFDFYNATQNVIIEVQGRQHTKYVSFLHGGNKINYLKQLKRDQDKLKFCEINSIKFCEYFDGENSLADLDKMLDL